MVDEYRTPLNNSQNLRVAKFWDQVEGKEKTVKCKLCKRYCEIPNNSYGACGVRKNIDGKLYTLVYGLLTAVAIDPIEKKPLFHFKPGSSVLSISTVGCNFFCQFCQNWEISQSRLEEGLYGNYYEPEEIVNIALSNRADGISYTYNEPTVFYEYMYDVAKIAKQKALFNTMVTNGYISEYALEEISPYMDAATVDFKGSGNKEFYQKYMGVPDPSPIFDTLTLMKEKKIHIEITDLVVPKIGDREEDIDKLTKWIVENLGDETPFHILRFYPQYKLNYLPITPVKTLEKFAEIAKNNGLKYVYIGNVPGHRLENTYCPSCGKVLIEREGFYIGKINLTEDGRCKYCGYKTNIIL
ncbi:MAG: AmmeMemoRadiSam system radical SAM enzyme [Fervidicoccus fontis]|uniref:AmmeMemoRadiSam system radical SAM enzyme n=1 Tax=Fervidicoccus fontis TaxID=683846 RepID=A0A2J6N2G0_9CREN|nr:MAG: AmmeMemoRadiSam system radical SAM enzyme [Fervidicoccus fontis]PMB75500.1 MAG: AmmeMemoRadiSam system radical SAM enzyme [Fervidicoccus fontis]PMB76252.1 MAG: AmmeMemoRadiSam system radical SAM enzyme [Fervidicoccus fontis]PMB78055.1 MAG: AmmeMemoRadiSam system radical SAM enzyme [Fervidicoccus fontis]